jgi:hypothetical protein
MIEQFLLAKKLITELLNDPDCFFQEGKSYDLLQYYFQGMPLQTLIPLLSSEDETVQRQALWITSELGMDGCQFLLPFVMPLLNSNERAVEYYSMECLMLGTVNGNYEKFVQLLFKLHSNDSFISMTAMRLISNANSLQLNVAIKSDFLASEHEACHREGLLFLRDIDLLDNDVIYRMIAHDSPMCRRYGAMGAKRLYKEKPYIAEYGLLSIDSDIQLFCNEIING